MFLYWLPTCSGCSCVEEVKQIEELEYRVEELELELESANSMVSRAIALVRELEVKVRNSNGGMATSYVPNPFTAAKWYTKLHHLPARAHLSCTAKPISPESRTITAGTQLHESETRAPLAHSLDTVL